MKYIKSIQIFESQHHNFNQLINDPKIINWWLENRKDITNIFLFKPKTGNIIGCFVDENTVCINTNFIKPYNDTFLLWILLHESRHADQHRNGIFSKGYFDTVINDDLDGFLKSYKKLEIDANNFAENSIKEMGIDVSENFINRMRSNENAGHMIFHMMKNDIKKTNAKTFKDLILSQIDII